ncbi:Corticosteroid-binding globulin [Amphibalanus amphitrite]|uniref:Corticosteroid-binding globulin n=1 Tax=Amphibalanus amphitrite TaxID=1232801 RepID=A0A6A4V3B5_AMPAM|nr:Corticosteroid-binding globulin [Amphibalanus amphitrite]
MDTTGRHYLRAAALLLLAATAAGLVIEKESPLLDLNDHLLREVLSGQQNEVVCPAALFNVIAGAHRAANTEIQSLIQRQLGTANPAQLSQAIDQMAAEKSSVKSFFRAYSIPRVRTECSKPQVTSVSKQQLCARLLQLLSPPTGRELDLGAAEAVRQINSDVSAATDGLISDLFTHLDPDSRLVLAAALAFSSPWLPELTISTKQLPFRRPAGEQAVPAVLVSGSMRFLNASDDGLYGVAVPYNDNAFHMEMFFFVAANRSEDVVSKLSRRHYEALAEISPLETQVLLTFPKFSIKSVKHDYRDVALSLGLGPMLEGGLGPNGADKVDQLVHRAVIDVDEKGTRAAGAAGISIIPRAGSDESTPRAVLQLDRPFVASVMHVELGLPLFTAHVVDPLDGAPATRRSPVRF